MAVSTSRIASRPRAYVRVAGPDAEDLLQRFLSNDVTQGDVVAALLLTPKGRLIAPLRAWRRGPDDFLLLTEPELGEAVRLTLVRGRFSAKCEIEAEEHTSTLVFGDAEGIPSELPGAVEVLDSKLEPTLGADELERIRIEAGIPAWGKELDDTILPAEAGLDETHVSFTKGCYPGQEPVARLHHRGHANRGLRVLAYDGAEVPGAGVEVLHEGRPVGRVTSAARGRERIVALAYVRAEVPLDAALTVGSAAASQLH